MTMPCDLCTDPDGVACFPLYGIGPGKQGAAGFTPDPAEPGCGTWWCPACGDGRPAQPAPDVTLTNEGDMAPVQCVADGVARVKARLATDSEFAKSLLPNMTHAEVQVALRPKSA